MRTLTLLALTAVSLAASVPVNAMMKHGMHPAAMAHMSAADTRRMQRCNAMSHSRMMHNPACARMMRMHSDMMHHDPMMKHEGAMKQPDAMSHDSMMKSGH